MKNETAKAVIRLIVTAMLMVNMCLTLADKNPIPFDEVQFTEFLTMCAAGLSTLWIWWKNNNITKTAKEAQGYKKALQEDGDGSDSQEVSDEV